MADERRYDARPLVGMFEDLEAAAQRLRTTTRSVMRWVQFGLSWDMADELAVRAGRHPGTIWPEWWDVEEDAQGVLELGATG